MRGTIVFVRTVEHTMKRTLRNPPVSIARVPVRRSRRLALLGAVVVLGLSACGDPAADGPSSSSIAPAVIQIAGAGGGGIAPMTEAAADGAGSSDAATSKMMAFVQYVFEGAAPDLTSPAGSWSFPASPVVDEGRRAALAEVFGIEGAAQTLAPEMGGGTVYGSTDYTGASVTFADDALQSWWYNPEPVTAEACAMYPAGDPAGDPTTAGMPVCEEPAPPVGIPTATEAEAKARELFTAMGLKADDYAFETYADEWGSSVTASLLVGGLQTPIVNNIGFGAEGAISWAGGTLATPVQGGDYPRIGVDAAVQRLNDQSTGWMTGRMAYSDTIVSREVATSGVATAAAETVARMPVEAAPEAVPEAAPETVPGDELVDPMVVTIPEECTDPAVSCLPTEPVDQQPVVVTLTDPEAALEQVWAADGTVWLLPAYRFATSDGGVVSVLAVEDQYLQQADAEVDTDIVLDIVPVPAPVEETVVAPNPSDVAVACPGIPTVVTEPALGVQVGGIVVGLCVADAATFIESYTPGASLRVVRENGVDLAATADFVELRVNVAVDNGLVTEVLSLG